MRETVVVPISLPPRPVLGEPIPQDAPPEVLGMPERVGKTTLPPERLPVRALAATPPAGAPPQFVLGGPVLKQP
jgi:hypothetical protein